MCGINVEKSPYSLGIDLGTTNTSVSVFSKGEAIALKLEGNITMPSVVRFPDRKMEGVQVGKQAKQYALARPDEVFSSIKTIMRDGNWDNDEVLKAKFKIGDVQKEPVDIAAEILKKAIEEAINQSEFDLEGEPQNAIICVPANTTDEYRKNIYRAAELAGLGEKDKNGDLIKDNAGRIKGITLLEEPVAASLAYGLDMGIFEEDDSREQTILVYDLGGGTFDATILHLDSSEDARKGNFGFPKFKVLSTIGIAKLGGDDFDEVVMKMCAEKFFEETNIDLFDTSKDNNATNKKTILESLQKLKTEAEKAKIDLALGKNSVTINIPEFLKDGDGATHVMDVEIKKSEYLERIKPLLEQTTNCVNDVIKEAGLSGIDDINRIVLVGGSTKADWIKDEVRKLGKEPFFAKNVDVIVSRGAAWYGANNLIPPPPITHYMGVALKGGKFGLVMEKGIEIPEEGIKCKQQFQVPKDRDSVNIEIWKTQQPIVFKSDEMNEPEDGFYVPREYETVFIKSQDKKFECIGTKVIRGLQPGEVIDVIMTTGQDNITEVSVKTMNSDKVVSIKLD
jgi:molecular chaperone DnaK (HSP70)